MERGFDVCSPRGGRHSRKSNWSMATIFLSTPSARRATRAASERVTAATLISIHALREEGDFIFAQKLKFNLISIHALREEGDCRGPVHQQVGGHHFYPRPPRGGRPSESWITWEPGKISIHALREEGDPRQGCYSSIRVQFLSTPSARRATTWQGGVFRWDYHFYPRPPRGGRQRIKIWVVVSTPYFYPRPPRGGRRSCCLTFSVCS